MAERFERHRQPWTSDEIQKLHLLARKGMTLKAIARALKRSEESVKNRAKEDGLRIARLRVLPPATASPDGPGALAPVEEARGTGHRG